MTLSKDCEYFGPAISTILSSLLSALSVMSVGSKQNAWTCLLLSLRRQLIINKQILLLSDVITHKKVIHNDDVKRWLQK